jgi:diguanylate cyclase (GGDEF)-like protein
LLGLTIVRPLRRLTRGADQVAAGNLDVNLPVHTRSEVGCLAQVFNHMLARQRRSRKELDNVNAERQAKNRELHQLSITDELTGLYNRNHMMETLNSEVTRSKRNGHTFALLVADIDHFKRINDPFGHQKGDEGLRLPGGVFRDTGRSCDYVARYGGEEFIVMLPEVGSAGGREVAERIRECVARERISPKGDRITISIGMATFPEHGGRPGRPGTKPGSHSPHIPGQAPRREVNATARAWRPSTVHPPASGKSSPPNRHRFGPESILP